MAMCVGKKKFATRESAEYILNRAWKGAIRSGNKDGNLPCRSYRCPTCHKYHLTSKPIRKRESNK